MYEASFGLNRRPFAATPDATCFLSAAPIQAALDEILVCIEQGQGIAVLTAPAGVGKTLLCERLCTELNDRFQIAFLRHSSFLTRRALLQTLLSELGHPYQQPSEQELRLELIPAIRELRSDREALVVICDEAHQLSDSLIEELRILADFAEMGRPLVRLILVGQLSLEEKLAQPGLEAFNQRIRAHVNLPTFDRAGSLDYIDYRLTWGGGRTVEIFTPAALDVIARASDGIPRCINQLADHSLLLGFVAEQRPVQDEIVLEALNDLRQLPLHWNETALPHAATSVAKTAADEDEESSESPSSGFDFSRANSNLHSMMYSYEPAEDEIASDDLSAHGTAFELGEFDQPNEITTTIQTDHVDSESENRIDVRSEDWRDAIDLFSTLPAVVSNQDSVQRKVRPVETEAELASSSDALSTHSDRLPVNSDGPAAFDAIASRSNEASITGTDEISNIVEFSSVSSLERWRDSRSVKQPVVQTISQAKSTESTSKFEEEVVIDRYVSIDAGLPPLSVSIPDAPIRDRVRANASILENEHHLTLQGHESIAEVGLGETTCQPQIDSAPTVPPKSSAVEPLDHVLGTVRELIEIVNEQRVDSQPALDRDDSVAETADEFEADSISILRSLRRDPKQQPTPTGRTAATEPANSSANAAWESVETAPVEAEPNPRPFRYLFSMLRRKQQHPS